MRSATPMLWTSALRFVSLTCAVITLTMQLTGCAASQRDPTGAGRTTFRVIATIPVPDNPHGTCFSNDGRTAYVACSGADQIAVMNTRAYQLRQTLPAGSVPLDVFLLPGSNDLVATQFRGDSLVKVQLNGQSAQPLTTLTSGPSLFNPAPINGRRYVTCEFSDKVFEIDAQGKTLRSWQTDDRPYPADIAPDGILLYVPCRDAGTVAVIDTLNNQRVASVSVGEHPEGGAVTIDNAHYLVACGGSNEVQWINTATWTVEHVLSDGIGPRPFSVVCSPDGRWAFVNNAGGKTVSVIDLRTRKVIKQLTVGAMPIVMRMHPDGKRLFVSCEGDHVVNVIAIDSTAPSSSAPKTQVAVLGMIHSGHRTSDRYSLDVIRKFIQNFHPDDICVEIPPNRFNAAADQFARTGQIEESRVRVFPEYVDVLFPLTRDMNFQIVPCAGWTAEMNTYRHARLDEISTSQQWKEKWAEHNAAIKRMESTITNLGPDDDPLIIHTDAYDKAIDLGYAGPYNTYFNDELGPGGWDNINTLHYRLIAQHLDSITGQGKRVLITFGAGHKGWLLRHLRQRTDIELIDPKPLFKSIENR